MGFSYLNSPLEDEREKPGGCEKGGKMLLRANHGLCRHKPLGKPRESLISVSVLNISGPLVEGEIPSRSAATIKGGPQVSYR